MKGWCNHIWRILQPFIPWCEYNCLQSQTSLFIFPFSFAAPSTEAHYEIMEKPFSIQRQLVAMGYESLICPQGDFADWNHYRREGLKRRRWRQAGPNPPEMGLSWMS